MKKSLFLLLFCFGLSPLMLTFSQGDTVLTKETKPQARSVFEMLNRADYLSMTLTLDFKNLVRHKLGDTYQSATMSFTDMDGAPKTWDVKIKPRGNMRRQVCEFPPFKIKFSKDDLAANGLKPYKTLKMVILCRDSKLNEQYVLREYFAYKLYNLLTNLSFQVQLVKVKFEDTGKKNPPDESFAFLIESDDEIEERLGGKMLKARYMSGRLLNTDESELFSMFEFMIGNTDWYVYNGHNVEVFGFEGTSVPIPIPYDFDYAGIVNTMYAAPNENFPKLRTVTERIYLGFCRKEEETQRTIQVFLDKKEEMLKLCEEFPHFDDNSRKHVGKYLKSFFEVIENPKWVKKDIFQHCDQWMK